MSVPEMWKRLFLKVRSVDVEMVGKGREAHPQCSGHCALTIGRKRRIHRWEAGTFECTDPASNRQALI